MPHATCATRQAVPHANAHTQTRSHTDRHAQTRTPRQHTDTTHTCTCHAPLVLAVYI